MKTVRFELNRAGVRELLQSSEMQNIVRGYAETVQRRAGDGYEVSVYTGRNRVNASVKAETSAAYRDTVENNTLLKALNN